MELMMNGTQSDFNHRLLLIRRIVFLQLALIVLATLFVFVAPRANLGVFWFAFLGGVLGASIALLRKITLGSKLDNYLSSTDWIVTASPFLYGGLMATVVYFLMISGLVSGDGGQGLVTSNLFPSFKPGTPLTDGQLLSMDQFRDLRPASVSDGAKVVIWCFIGGYSESFVTGLLSSLERGSGIEESEESIKVR
jgi:hypothetical protein